MRKIAYFLLKIANKMLAKHKDPSLQKFKEMECVKEGHLWTKYDDPNKKLKDRMYCRRCGQMYHEHTYIGTQV